MVVLFGGELVEHDVSQILNYQQILDGLEYRKNYIGQSCGDFEIISVDYDWGLRKQVNVARCSKCGLEKEIPDMAAFMRGKGVARYCKCRNRKKEYVPQNEIYRARVGEELYGFRLIDYREGKGFRAECVECGKQKWVTGKAALGGEVVCNHKIVRDYSEPKYMGMRVGNLTAVERVGGRKYRFLCDCGEEIIVDPSDVFRGGVITTCGRPSCKYHQKMLTSGNDARRTGISFEYACAEEILRQGHFVEMTPSTGDYGVDFFAVIDGERVAFQCKRLSRCSTVRGVQEVFAGSIYYGCDRCVVVSPTGFTERAEILAIKLGVQLEETLLNFKLK